MPKCKVTVRRDRLVAERAVLTVDTGDAELPKRSLIAEPCRADHDGKDNQTMTDTSIWDRKQIIEVVCHREDIERELGQDLDDDLWEELQSVMENHHSILDDVLAFLKDESTDMSPNSTE